MTISQIKYLFIVKFTLSMMIAQFCIWLH